MSITESKEGVCISGERKLPATAATQFADNAEKPFWSFKGNATASDDFFDCYVSFKELDCHEYMWDWQGRKIDSDVVKRLITHYHSFFRDRPIGKRFFLTFRTRADNPVEELGKMYLSIISSNDFAKGKGSHTPPVFEIAHSVASPDDLARFTGLYNESVGIATEKLGHDCGPKVLSVIPSHDFSRNDWYSCLNSFFDGFQSGFRCRVDYFRPLIPRSTLADRFGFVAATLATKRALASYGSFAKITGIEAYPILDVGPLLFRGGLNPDELRGFIRNYPGTRTVTINPSFRYDYPVEDVKEAIHTLNRALPRNKPAELSQEDMKRISIVEKIFAKNYRQAIARLPELRAIADSMRLIKGGFASSIDFSFALYSLGIPPEVIGTGRSILECIKEGIINDLEHSYPNIKDDIIASCRLLNKENLGLFFPRS